jgi:hypothetical protein
VVVTPSEDKVRISTSEGTVEFRPRRLRWTAADSFVVVGLDKDSKLKRSYLRFKSIEEASEAATIIKRSSSVMEEPLVAVEEFPVQFQLLPTAGYIAVLISGLFVRLFIVALLVLVFLDAFGIVGVIAAAVYVLGFVAFPLWVAFSKARRRTQGWVRFEGRSIIVRGRELTPVYPRMIEWKSPKVIVIRGQGTKLELSFPTSQDLTQAVTKIRTAYPKVQEILSEIYEQDPL